MLLLLFKCLNTLYYYYYYIYYIYIYLLYDDCLQLIGRIKTVSGKPGEQIIMTAKQEKATLIVIGCRGLSKVKRTLQVSKLRGHHCGFITWYCIRVSYMISVICIYIYHRIIINFNMNYDNNTYSYEVLI